jgi:hemolysin activation/secretion protein
LKRSFVIISAGTVRGRLRRARVGETAGAAIFIAAAVWAWPAAAQTPPAPRAPAEAFPQVPQLPPPSALTPESPPGAGPGLPATGPATPGETPAAQVAIRGVRVTGATALPQAELEAAVAGLVGPSVPLSRVEAARVDLLNRYRGAGYALTTVTATLAAGGALTFAVTEARIVAVKLDGDIGPAGVQVLRFLNHLTELPAIDTASLERWLLLANDIPGVTVHAVLRPSSGDPGALTLVAQVSRQAVSGLASVDNRGFRLAGPLEYLGVVDFNSFTEFGERTELSIFHTDAGTQNFGVASEEFFVGGSGLKVRLYGGSGEANPGGFLRTVGYEGLTTVAGISGSYPVIRSREQTLVVDAFLDIEQSEVRADTTGTGTRTGHDDLQIGRLGVDYTRQDLFAGIGRPAINTATARLSQGLPFLGGTQNGSASATRLNETTGFTKIAAELVRTQTLFAPWPDATVALKLLAAGQASGDVLPPVEKFYLGGSEFTRGFYAGQATGDTALAATAELQLNTPYDFTAFDRSIAVNAQWYVFYDWGEAWQNQAIDPGFRLTSEGGGVRLSITRYTEFDVEGVVRNTRLPEGTPGTVKAEKADAVFWRVLTRF